MTFVSALASIGVTGALTGALGTTAGTIAAGALAGAGTGAALGGVGSALTGGDIGEGMGMGALTGAVGGGVTGGLQSMASPAAQAGAETAKLAVPAATEVVPQQVTANLGQGIGAAPAAQAGAQLAPGAMQVVPQQVTANLGQGITANPITAPSFSEQIGNFAVKNPTLTAGVTGLAAGQMLEGLGNSSMPGLPQYSGPLSKFNWAGPNLTFDPYKYKARGMATGGITDLDSFGANSQTVPNINEVSDPEGYGRPSTRMLASGGISNLGSYSDGGQLLKGPGDGVSDDIPASIGGSQPARLADGEFVVPARIVSELGNGSTDAGAKKLYDMMNRVQQARGKTTGKNDIARNSHADKYLPV